MGNSGSVVKPEITTIQINEGEDADPIYRHKLSKDKLMTTFDENVTTLSDVLKKNGTEFKDRPFLYSRKKDEKGVFGPYIPETYGQVLSKVKSLGSYFVNVLKLEKSDIVGLWANNCSYWDITDFACNSYSLISVPLYSTLGEKACLHILNETKVKVIVLSSDHLDFLLNIADDVELTDLILIDKKPTDSELNQFKDKNISLSFIEDCLIEGSKNCSEFRPFDPDDTFTISYTSGTTGLPKGVVHTNGTFIAALSGIMKIGKFQFNGEDRFLSYLPSAHIYARIAHALLCIYGAAIYYWIGDVKTLFTEDTIKVKPTVFCGVPRVYNKLYSKITEMVKNASPLKQKLFNYAFSAQQQVAPTGGKSFWDFVFSKLRNKIGLGSCRLFVSGAGPLDPIVHDWMQVVLGPVAQGYGLTETASALTAQNVIPVIATAQVGSVLRCCEIKLVSVPDMKYDSRADPPRGEVCTRGPNVFKGYYLNEKKTSEVLEEDGWFHTGDIAQYNKKSGSISIIDRKKFIFKLSQGEYIAPDYIQNVYTRNPFVASIFVHGESLKSCLVAVVCPEPEVLIKYAKENGYDNTDNLKSLCENKKIIEHIFTEMSQTANDAKLKGFEKVRGLYLEPEPWTVPLVSPTFKLCRSKIRDHYKKEIEELYQQIESTN